ncbi:hypothetical protein B0H11DRAFT_1648010, partial [Mycena galericulata]
LPPSSRSAPPAAPTPPATPVARSVPPECPPKAAEWFVHALGQMTQKDLGGHFNAVLAAWIRLEKACRWETPNHYLSAKGRPEQVTKWIAAARGRKAPAPAVTNVAAYAKGWWIWWDSLQPEWRTRDPDGMWKIHELYDGDWDDKLLHWGPNGTLSVVASLYFWGCAVIEAPESQDEWELAVNDVAWILEGL